MTKVVDIWIKANTFDSDMLEQIRAKAQRGEGSSRASRSGQDKAEKMDKGHYQMLALCCNGVAELTEIISPIPSPSPSCVPLAVLHSLLRGNALIVRSESCACLPP